MNQSEGARELVRAVQSRKPYAAGKLGTSEFEALYWYVTQRKSMAQPRPYPNYIFLHMTVNAGLFPATEATLDEWSEYMIQAVLPNMDLMVEWNPSAKHHEQQFLNTYSPYSKRTVLRALEPYYEPVTNRYTLAIPENSKIAVISPFSNTILHQIPKLESIWSQIWPPVSMSDSRITIIPIQTFFTSLVGDPEHQWPDRISNWRLACDDIVEKVKAVGAQYVFIGCGALSLPIAAAVKELGCVAIHTGGATQILFGIKGRRWDTHTFISKCYNTSWIRPLPSDVPIHAYEIENGCYF